MAEIELGPLSDRLEDDDMRALVKGLEQQGVKLGKNDDHNTQTIAARLSEDAMTEFLDRLDAHDLAAEIYLPLEFDGVVQAGDFRVASTQALVDVLEELKEELAVEEDDYDDEEEEEEYEDDGTVIEAQLKNIWRLVTDACTESVDRGVPLHLRV